MGTRPSPMAMEQTGRVARAFRSRYPDMDLDILKITSEGDAHRGPLSTIGGKGAFTRRADERLLDGRVEATIACAKDVPGPHDRAPGITVGAVLPREDTRDVLVSPAGGGGITLAELPPGTRVGTSAPRRTALLKAIHPQLIAVPIRGNADSRIAALDSGSLGVEVMIAALAGLRRLGQEHRAREILDPAVWLTAAGAGIVVIEHRADDRATGELLAPLTHAPTRILLDAERAVLATLHGGCLTAASAHATLDVTGERVTVHAVVLDPAGGAPLRATASGPATMATAVGQDVGEQLLAAFSGLRNDQGLCARTRTLQLPHGRCQPGSRGADSPHHRPCDHVVVSYDLAVWDGERPLDDDAAGSAFDEMHERYLESEDVAVPPSPRIEAYVNALIERYPEDDRDSPWASPPVIDEASGPIVYLLMSYSRAEEVSEYAASLAREYGLICFDPQGETLRS
ncbi:hydroxymethylbilane synthase [Streptomyces sp. NPDC059176]|uniref:hydroxymethylbilane synthase n=1 Tax=Streptomyces sp. NPDC059176 TaxID=3346758 RepID=UPI0036788719